MKFFYKLAGVQCGLAVRPAGGPPLNLLIALPQFSIVAILMVRTEAVRQKAATGRIKLSRRRNSFKFIFTVGGSNRCFNMLFVILNSFPGISLTSWCSPSCGRRTASPSPVRRWRLLSSSVSPPRAGWRGWAGLCSLWPGPSPSSSSSAGSSSSGVAGTSEQSLQSGGVCWCCV